MLRTKLFVAPVGDHWEVACTLRGQPTTRHVSRFAALQSARLTAQDLWTQPRVACEVLIDEDDGIGTRPPASVNCWSWPRPGLELLKPDLAVVQPRPQQQR